MKSMNSKRIIVLLLVIMSFSLAGCGEEVKTVEWYKAPENKDALEAKLAECRNNPGQLQNTPNCQNARAAFQDIFTGGSFEKVKEPTFGF